MTARPHVRALVLLAAAVFAATALTAAPASADEVPPEWGDPVFQAGYWTVVGRQDGHLPHRRGNQHVVLASTNDEDVVIGQVNDWWCPAGITAPVYWSEQSTCRLRRHDDLEFDYPAYAAGAPTTKTWATKLRWMKQRTPVQVLDGTDGTTVRRGNLSVRIRANGALNLEVWDIDDTSTWLTRQGAHIVGGRFLGTRWRDMTSVQVGGALTQVRDNEIGLYSYYDVPVT
jgi:hypothetical protein